MTEQKSIDGFFPLIFQKVYPPHPSQEAQVNEEVKREFILRYNKKLALVKYSNNEGLYILGTLIVKDDKC